MPLWHVLALAVALGVDAMSVCAAVGVRWHGPRQKFRLAWHMGLFQFLMPVAGYLAGKPLAAALAAVGSYVAAALVFAVGLKMLYEALRQRGGAEPGQPPESDAADQAAKPDRAERAAKPDRAHRAGQSGRADLTVQPDRGESAGQPDRGDSRAEPDGSDGAAAPDQAARPARPGEAPDAGRAARRRDPTRGWSLIALSVATSLDALVVGFSLSLRGATGIWWPCLTIGLVAGLMSLTGVFAGQHLGRALGKPAELAAAAVLILLAASFLIW